MNFMHLHINIHNYMKYSKAALLYSKESLNKRKMKRIMVLKKTKTQTYLKGSSLLINIWERI